MGNKDSSCVEEEKEEERFSLDPRNALGHLMKASSNCETPIVNQQIRRKKILVNFLSSYQNILEENRRKTELLSELDNLIELI